MLDTKLFIFTVIILLLITYCEIYKIIFHDLSEIAEVLLSFISVGNVAHHVYIDWIVYKWHTMWINLQQKAKFSNLWFSAFKWNCHRIFATLPTKIKLINIIIYYENVAFFHAKLVPNICPRVDKQTFKMGRAVGCVVKVSAHGSEGRWFDTRLHQLSD